MSIEEHEPTTLGERFAAFRSHLHEGLIQSGWIQYEYAHDILVKLPGPKREQLLHKIDSYLNPDTERLTLSIKEHKQPEEIDDERINHRIETKQRIFKELFSETDSNQVDSLNDLAEMPDLLKHGCIIDIISIMADDPNEFRFPLAELLSNVPLSDLSPETVKKLNPVLSESEIEIISQNQEWYLCTMSEGRLYDALTKEDPAVIVINDSLVMKYEGKNAALCIKTVRVGNNDVFVAGSWYSPIEKDLRHDIAEAFDNGQGKVRIDHGTWAVMRSMEGHNTMNANEFLEYVRLRASALPEQGLGKIGDQTRKRYRESAKERMSA